MTGYADTFVVGQDIIILYYRRSDIIDNQLYLLDII